MNQVPRILKLGINLKTPYLRIRVYRGFPVPKILNYLYDFTKSNEKYILLLGSYSDMINIDTYVHTYIHTRIKLFISFGKIFNLQLETLTT